MNVYFKGPLWTIFAFLLIFTARDTAIGGEPITRTIEGRERYTVAIRYPRDYRNNPEAIASEVLIPTPSGGTVPLGEVAGDQNTVRLFPCNLIEEAAACMPFQKIEMNICQPGESFHGPFAG